MRFSRLIPAVSLCAASLAGAQTQPGAPRLVITPAPQTVVSGDSLQLHAQLVDAGGKPVPNAKVTFRPAGAFFEGSIDTTGLVRAGTVGTLPVAAIALIPGEKPVVHRFDVTMLAGPASRIDVSPKPTRLLP
ncbi:MAG: hypothetical protein ABIT20_10925, partial [Gemmatimonadaceae bacterium]